MERDSEDNRVFLANGDVSYVFCCVKLLYVKLLLFIESDTVLDFW